MNALRFVMRILSCALMLASAVAVLGQAKALPDSDDPGLYQRQIYHRLLPQIEKIPIFDHHAHPGFADDPDVDAMAAPPGAEALRVRDTNPELVSAAKALWGYPYDDFSEEHAKWLVAKKAEAKKKYPGAAYFNMILDRVGIEREVANRAMMADYLDAKRFPWVFFVDSFMFPFDNTQLRQRNLDQGVYIPLQEKMLKRWMQQESVRALPANFADYLAFISHTLEANQKKGAIAMKFEAAYFRPLKFGDPSLEQVEALYAKYHAGGVPSWEEYLTFSDYIFRYLATEGGRLNLPVHIHSAIGIGDYFSLTQGNIMNLENVLRDPRYAKTTFVMIHGGYPYEREAIFLAALKNVWMDSSLQELFMYPSEFKHSLKQWLETFPDKITFGTDSFPYNDVLGAEESTWLGVQSGREALAAALAEMVSLREVNEKQALDLARGYLHDNAMKIYEGKFH
jgi:uncharacterized protein